MPMCILGEHAHPLMHTHPCICASLIWDGVIICTIASPPLAITSYHYFWSLSPLSPSLSFYRSPRPGIFSISLAPKLGFTALPSITLSFSLFYVSWRLWFYVLSTWPRFAGISRVFKSVELLLQALLNLYFVFLFILFPRHVLEAHIYTCILSCKLYLFICFSLSRIASFIYLLICCHGWIVLCLNCSLKFC